MTTPWPDLPYAEWAETRATLHLWTQVVGKLKLVLTPFQNEWWNVGLQLTARGLTTGPMPAGSSMLQVDFDFLQHVLTLHTSDGNERTVELAPRSVADFHTAVTAALDDLGIVARYSTLPAELPGAVPFEQDELHASYDGDAVQRWWRAMLAVSRQMDVFRSHFSGKASPVLFYWGGFDLNHSRFNGRPAPVRPGAGRVLSLGEDQENMAIGFWPGSDASPEAVLYAYLSPAPPGVELLAVQPSGATWVEQLGEFVLPWSVLAGAADADQLALTFFSSAYEQLAKAAQWDVAALQLTPPTNTEEA